MNTDIERMEQLLRDFKIEYQSIEHKKGDKATNIVDEIGVDKDRIEIYWQGEFATAFFVFEKSSGKFMYNDVTE